MGFYDSVFCAYSSTYSTTGTMKHAWRSWRTVSRHFHRTAKWSHWTTSYQKSSTTKAEAMIWPSRLTSTCWHSMTPERVNGLKTKPANWPWPQGSNQPKSFASSIILLSLSFTKLDSFTTHHLSRLGTILFMYRLRVTWINILSWEWSLLSLFWC